MPDVPDVPDRSAEFADIAGLLLWETDARARLSWLRGRLPGLGAAVPEALPGRRAGAVLTAPSRRALERALARRAPFDDVCLNGRDGTALRVGGRPRVDARGAFAGHRGVARIDGTGAGDSAPWTTDDESLRALVEALPVCIAYVDGALRYRMANTAYLHWFGLPFEALRGRHMRSVIGERAYGEARLAIDCALYGETILYDETLSTSDDEVRDLQTTLVPHLDAAGEVLGLFVLSHDISDQKRRGDRLARSLGHLSAALDGLDTALVVLDARARIRTDNASWRALRDAASGSAVGDPSDYRRLALALLGGEDDGGARDTVDAVADFARDRGPSVGREVEFVDGRGPRVVSVTTSAFLDAQLRFVLVAHRDVTESTLLARRLQAQDTADARTARLDSLGELAATMAHELNQPLTAIGNFAALALADAPPAPANGEPGVRALLERLVGETRRAAEIVRRVNRSVRQLPGARTRIDPAGLVDEVVRRLERRTVGRHVPIESRVHGPLPGVQADAGQIEQVLHNAVTNSLEAIVDAGVGTRIELTLRADEGGGGTGGVVFEITDDGPGFSPELLERALEPFVSSKADGMGLGLAICRSIVESHGGWIRCERPREGGARLSFVLPPETPR